MQNGEIIHKPKQKQDAIEILRKLSGKSHEVITGVCITSSEKKIVFSSITDVFFTNLSDEEINFYLPIGNRYACEAYYSVGLQTIIALDGGRLRQRSEVNCDETCYKESNLNLDLRKL